MCCMVNKCQLPVVVLSLRFVQDGQLQEGDVYLHNYDEVEMLILSAIEQGWSNIVVEGFRLDRPDECLG